MFIVSCNNSRLYLFNYHLRCIGPAFIITNTATYKYPPTATGDGIHVNPHCQMSPPVALVHEYTNPLPPPVVLMTLRDEYHFLL